MRASRKVLKSQLPSQGIVAMYFKCAIVYAPEIVRFTSEIVPLCADVVVVQINQPGIEIAPT
jgi:hypothetical protein